ncbi:hypothetical protein CR513_26894, partial [Mucuna pruriens]
MLSTQKSYLSMLTIVDKRDFFSKVGLENGNPFKYNVTKRIGACNPSWFLSKKKEDWSMQSKLVFVEEKYGVEREGNM